MALRAWGGQPASRSMNFLFVGHDDAGENLAGLYEASEGTAQTRAVVGLKQVGGGRAEDYVKTRIPGR